jgi:hypothetical protein
MGDTDDRMSTAGYSGTPLWKKLGLQAGATGQILHAPDGWAVSDAPEVAWLASDSDAPASVILAFYREPDAFLAELEELAARVRPAGMIWAAWPRKATGHDSAMTENLIRDAGLEIGLVDVKVAALDEAWSGLKLVWRRERR